jgi:TPR repeat protein
MAQDRNHIISREDIGTLVELNPTTIQTLLQSAQKEDQHAMLLVGEAYWLGLGGLSASQPDALEWLNMAIKYGESDANALRDFILFSEKNQSNLLNVTTTLESGWKSLTTEEKLNEQSKNVIEALAYTGLPEAEAEFALLAMKGDIDEDPNTVIDMINDASSSKSGNTVEKIAYCYQEGIILDKNPELASRLYLKAANLGRPDSQLMVARLILQNHYMDRDIAEAIKWLELSADNGNQEAITALGDVKKVVDPNIWLDGFSRANEWRRNRK